MACDTATACSMVPRLVATAASKLCTLESVTAWTLTWLPLEGQGANLLAYLETRASCVVQGCVQIGRTPTCISTFAGQ